MLNIVILIYILLVNQIKYKYEHQYTYYSQHYYKSADYQYRTTIYSSIQPSAFALAPMSSITIGGNMVDVAIGYNNNTIVLKNTSSTTNMYTYYPFNSTNA